jgi:hypothetical protein
MTCFEVDLASVYCLQLSSSDLFNAYSQGDEPIIEDDDDDDEDDYDDEDDKDDDDVEGMLKFCTSFCSVQVAVL